METFTPRMLEEAAATFSDRCSSGAVKAALVAGSGITLQLPGWERTDVVEYADIFPFPVHALPGHSPTASVWRRGDDALLAFDGRFHLYQGYSTYQVAAIPRLAALLGARTFVATNAAGSLDPEVDPGSLVVVRDHINLQGANPLVGEWGRWREPAFPDMTSAYDLALRRAAARHARDVGFRVCEGVYAGVLGPSFETPAEIAMLKVLGATVVGMSTVPEVIAAVHCGMRVGVLSLATNLAAGIGEGALTHEEVLVTGEAAKERLGALLDRLMGDVVMERL
jgi:purine-nucleoside phosphorylase